MTPTAPIAVSDAKLLAIVKRMLEQTGGNITQVARQLGKPRYWVMKRLPPDIEIASQGRPKKDAHDQTIKDLRASGFGAKKIHDTLTESGVSISIRTVYNRLAAIRSAEKGAS